MNLMGCLVLARQYVSFSSLFRFFFNPFLPATQLGQLDTRINRPIPVTLLSSKD